MATMHDNYGTFRGSGANQFEKLKMQGKLKSGFNLGMFLGFLREGSAKKGDDLEAFVHKAYTDMVVHDLIEGVFISDLYHWIEEYQAYLKGETEFEPGKSPGFVP